MRCAPSGEQWNLRREGSGYACLQVYQVCSKGLVTVARRSDVDGDAGVDASSRTLAVSEQDLVSRAQDGSTFCSSRCGEAVPRCARHALGDPAHGFSRGVH